MIARQEFVRSFDRILNCICVCFMQSQAKLESEIAKLKEQNERTKDEGNSLQEKLLLQVSIGRFPKVNLSLNLSWVFATDVYNKFQIYLIHVKYLIFR